MTCSVNTKSKKKSSKNSSPIITLADSRTGDSSAKIPIYIHVVESSMAKSKSGSKKKRKKKNKQNSKEKSDKTKSTDEKRKPLYPYLICDKDNFTRDYPHCVGVMKIVKSSQMTVVLKDPFPSQDSKMIDSSSNASKEPIMMTSHVRIAT